MIPNLQDKNEILSHLTCADRCDKFCICVDLENMINADTKQPIDFSEYIISNHGYESDIEKPPRYSRAFRRKCVVWYDNYDKNGNMTRYHNIPELYNCRINY